jgi:Carboxypeptidase regulatory-like domain
MQKSFIKWIAWAAIAALTAVLSPSSFAQGVVSSGMTGTLVDSSGKPIAKATIVAVHTPTNTKFTATTNDGGRFFFKGMPVGGPYTVTATGEGLAPVEITDIQTSLGEDTDVTLTAKAEVVKLENFVVSASTTDLDANATGAGTVLDSHQIVTRPTINRSFTDLIKTNPFVSVRGYPQVEALGMNYRYNTITLDGAKINDSFGLNNSGLFSLNNPFSLDAVEQFSISLTPYDVRQSGFAGASINAVSKSGTNELHGSMYFIYTDENWQGPDEFGTTIHTRSPLKERTYGFTLGGPIWKDHLFFFINWEKFFQDKAPTQPAYTPNQAFLDAVAAKAATLPGSPDIGTFGGASTSRTDDTKRLIKVDWNINQDHRLSVRYSDTIGAQPNFGSFNYTSFSQPAAIPGQPSSFTNGGTGVSSAFYNLDIKEHVWAAQLFSNWTSDLKTEVDYSYTKQDSVRSVPLAFPEVRIFNVPGTSNAGSAISTNDAFRFGSEISSQGNELHIKTQTAAASGDYTWKDFTFSGGADYESSDYFNLFRQGSYGYFDYLNLAAFEADTPFGFGRAVVQQGFPTADISKFERTGVFGQVKWEPVPRLSLILGLRYDFVGSPIAPAENVAFKNAFGVTNAGTVDGTDTPQPRFSFNYAFDSERKTQIRGGYGVFLGRNPWVWISNSYGNTGVGRFNVVSPSGATPVVPTLTQYLNGTYVNTDPAFKFDPANPIGTTNAPGTASSINLIKPGMKLPTIARGNIAIDRKIPFLDAIASIEYIDTEQLDALFVDNMNLRPTTVGADGRQRFAGSATAAPLVPGFANVIRTRDIHEGESQYLSISLNHPLKNHWAYGAAYTHGHATDTQGLGSSTANSQWQFNNVFNQNAVEVSRSDFEVKDRIQASVSREFIFHKNYITTISLYYEGRSGQPYSYVYGNDLNTDGFSSNDLVAVPTGPSDPRFDFSGMNAAQQSAYFAYLNSSGLSKYAGSYAPRNAFFTPWQNRLDLDFRQVIPVYSAWGKNIRLECFLDFINFGSWLDKHLFNYIEEINTSTTNSSQLRALGSATYDAAGLVRPTVVLNPDGSINFPSGSQIVVNNNDARWKIQAGVSLKF